MIVKFAVLTVSRVPRSSVVFSLLEETLKEVDASPSCSQLVSALELLLEELEDSALEDEEDEELDTALEELLLLEELLCAALLELEEDEEDTTALADELELLEEEDAAAAGFAVNCGLSFLVAICFKLTLLLPLTVVVFLSNFSSVQLSFFANASCCGSFALPRTIASTFRVATFVQSDALAVLPAATFNVRLFLTVFLSLLVILICAAVFVPFLQLICTSCLFF